MSVVSKVNNTVASDRETADFSWPVRVYYEDTDHGGVVYYANYLKFMERARTEWLRAKGIEQDALIDKQAVIFAVRSVQVDYLRPARFNQQLAVSVRLVEGGKASLVFEQEVSLADNKQKGGEHGRLPEQQVLCRGRIKIACLDAQSLKPRAMPAPLREEIFGDN